MSATVTVNEPAVALEVTEATVEASVIEHTTTLVVDGTGIGGGLLDDVTEGDSVQIDKTNPRVPVISVDPSSFDPFGAAATVAGGLATEVARAELAESDLGSALAAEIIDRMAAVGGVQTNLTTEVARAETAEGDIATDLATEVARAELAETDLGSALAAEILDRMAADALLQPLSARGQINGYASLDGSGKVPTSQLPAFGAVTSVDGRAGVVTLTDLYDAAGAAATAQAASQPLATPLTALAGVSPSANTLPYFTGANTAATTALSPFMRSVLDDIDAATVRGTLGLGSAALNNTGDFDAAGTAAAGDASEAIARDAAIATAVANLINSAPGALDTLNELATALGDDPNFATTVTNALALKQPLDAELTALAGVTSAADKLPYFTGSGTAAVTDLSAFVRTVLDDANAAAVRTTLGLGTAAVAATGDFDAAGAAAAAQAASQPLDSDLTAIALLSTANYGRSFLTLADAAAGRTLLGLGGAAVLSVGTTAGTVAAGDDSRLSDTRTPTDNTVTSAKIVDGAVANADLANMANKTYKGRHTAGTGAPEDVSIANLILDLALVAANISDFDTQVRTNRLDQMTTPTADVSFGTKKITNLANATTGTDALNRQTGDLRYDLAGAATTVLATAEAYTDTAIATEDALVVHKAGTETITGAKSAQATITTTPQSDTVEAMFSHVDQQTIAHAPTGLQGSGFNARLDLTLTEYAAPTGFIYWSPWQTGSNVGAGRISGGPRGIFNIEGTTTWSGTTSGMESGVGFQDIRGFINSPTSHGRLFSGALSFVAANQWIAQNGQTVSWHSHADGSGGPGGSLGFNANALMFAKDSGTVLDGSDAVFASFSDDVFFGAGTGATTHIYEYTAFQHDNVTIIGAGTTTLDYQIAFRSATMSGATVNRFLHYGDDVTAPIFSVSALGTIASNVVNSGAFGVVANLINNTTAAATFLVQRKNADLSALASGTQIGNYSLGGWDGTAISGAPAPFSLRAYTTETWGATAHGTEGRVYTTPNTTTTPILAATFGQDQSLTVVSSINASKDIVLNNLTATTNAAWLSIPTTAGQTIATRWTPFAAHGGQLITSGTMSAGAYVVYAAAASIILNNSMAPTAGTVSAAAFSDTSTVTSNAAALTLGVYRSFSAGPTLQQFAGNITSGQWVGYGTSPVVTGITLSAVTHFQVSDVTNGGTITTQYGLDIPALAGATTNIGIRNLSSSVLKGPVYGDTANNGVLDLHSTSGTGGTINAHDKLVAFAQVYGNTAISENLYLNSTTNASKGAIFANDQLFALNNLTGSASASGNLVLVSTSDSAKGSVLIFAPTAIVGYATNTPTALFGVDSTVTITANNTTGAAFPAFISHQAAYTLAAAGSTNIITGVEFAPAVSVGFNLGTNALAPSVRAFRDGGTYTSTIANAIAGVYQSFTATPTFTRTSTNAWANGIVQTFAANPSLTAMTLTTLTGYNSTLTTAASGSITTYNGFSVNVTPTNTAITTANGLNVLATVTASGGLSGSIGTLNGVKVANPTLTAAGGGTATIDTLIGVDIAALAAATGGTPATNIGIRNASSLRQMAAMTLGADAVASTGVVLDVQAGGLVATRKSTVALSNGVNDNVTLPTSSFVTITGPSAWFSLAGIASGVNGAVVNIVNLTGFGMAIVNEGTSSTAANRITTGLGVDAIIGTNGVAMLQYDTGTSRWVLLNPDDPAVSTWTGDGSDGVAVFDGTNTFAAFATTSGAAPNLVYTLTRDIYVADGSGVSSGKTLNTANNRIFCKGKWNDNGTRQNNGGAASGTNQATGGTNSGNASLTAGSAGATGTTGGAVNGTANTNVPYGSASVGNGGAGGAGGTSGGTAGGANRASTPPGANVGGAAVIRNPWQAIEFIQARAMAALNPSSSGSAGAGDGTNPGGGGGAGGGAMVLVCNIWAGTGTVQCNGGNGGTPTTAANLLSCGGGGGGGGGISIVVAGLNAFTGTHQALGGTHGTRVNGAGGALGTNGSDGGAGTVLVLTV